MKNSKLRTALMQISTGHIVGGRTNYKDTVAIMKQIANDALAHTNDVLEDGVSLISEERQKQILKHGFTGRHHANIQNGMIDYN